MIIITEISQETVYSYNKMSRKSNKKAKEIRSLMLDLLAKAYESSDDVANCYIYRANDILSVATNQLLAKKVYKIISEE